MGRKKIKICPNCKIREKAKGKDKHYKGYCEACIKEYYQKNKEKLKRYSRKYNRIYRQKHKDKDRAYQKTPDRIRKQTIRDYAKGLLKNGKIQKIKCDYCGEKKELEFHHPDYDKPKEFIILCKKCHLQEHYKNRLIGEEKCK